MSAYLEAENGQVVFAPVLEMRKGLDIEGHRFGRLIAMRIVNRTDQGNLWLLKCDCGSYSTKVVSELRAAQRAGREQMCRACSARKTGNRIDSDRRIRQERYVRNAAEGLGLYPGSWEAEMVKSIRAEVELRLGVEIETEPDLVGLVHVRDGEAFGSFSAAEPMPTTAYQRFAVGEEQDEEAELEIAELLLRSRAAISEAVAMKAVGGAL